jgi:hypothetical protein
LLVFGLRRRLVLPIVAATALLAFGYASSAYAATSSDDSPTFSNGFAELAAQIPDSIGAPLTPELPGDEPGSIIQLTSNGIAYWAPTHAPSFFDASLNQRWAILPSHDVTQWSGSALDPPPPEQTVASVSARGPPATGSIPNYIGSHSRYGQRAVCVSRIETGGWTAYYNKTPVGREHAQGYFGWLPSTAATVGAQIMDLDSEIAGFDRMMAVGRGKEFYGIRAGLC